MKKVRIKYLPAFLRCCIAATVWVIASDEVMAQRQLGFSIEALTPQEDWSVENFGYSEDKKSDKKIFALGLAGTIRTSASTSLRIRAGWTRINVSNFKGSSLDEIEDFYNKGAIISRQTKFHLIPGYIWDRSFQKMNLYAGIEMPINIHGEFEREERTENYSEGSIYSEYGMITTTEGGYSLGLSTVTGVRFFVWDQLSIGSEIVNSVLYRSIGGERKVKTIGWVDDVRQTDKSLKGVDYRTMIFSINLSYWLNPDKK